MTLGTANMSPFLAGALRSMSSLPSPVGESAQRSFGKPRDMQPEDSERILFRKGGFMANIISDDPLRSSLHTKP